MNFARVFWAAIPTVLILMGVIWASAHYVAAIEHRVTEVEKDVLQDHILIEKADLSGLKKDIGYILKNQEDLKIRMDGIEKYIRTR